MNQAPAYPTNPSTKEMLARYTQPTDFRASARSSLENNPELNSSAWRILIFLSAPRHNPQSWNRFRVFQPTAVSSILFRHEWNQTRPLCPPAATRQRLIATNEQYQSYASCASNSESALYSTALSG